MYALSREQFTYLLTYLLDLESLCNRLRARVADMVKVEDKRREYPVRRALLSWRAVDPERLWRRMTAFTRGDRVLGLVVSGKRKWVRRGVAPRPSRRLPRRQWSWHRGRASAAPD